MGLFIYEAQNIFGYKLKKDDSGLEMNWVEIGRF